MRYNVVEISGIAGRAGVQTFDRRESRKVLAASTVRRRVADMRRWSSGIYDSFGDTGDMSTLRVVTATHYNRGVENVRILRIRPVSR